MVKNYIIKLLFINTMIMSYEMYTYLAIYYNVCNQVMMTPEDFLRSISPGEKQPDHLGLDQFLQVTQTKLRK